jgi:hypothetical protein
MIAFIHAMIYSNDANLILLVGVLLLVLRFRRG